MATIKPREEPTRALAMWRVFPLPRRSTSAQIVVQNLAVAGGYIAQWLERLTADQQVPGSNPGVPLLFAQVVAGGASANLQRVRPPGIEPGTI